MMASLHWELRLIARSHLSACALALLLLLSSVAVWSGLHATERQRQTIARLAELHEQDVTAVAGQYAGEPDAGNAAYFTFYNTWDAPSDTAFLALGMRDVAPYVLRVRALGLQAQIHEGETFNPELALPGRFDFAFVLIYLAPLFTIALLHDMVSGERHAGRLRLLLSLPGAAAGSIALIAGVAASYLAFWCGLCLLIAARGWRSVANATALMAAWTVLTLVLPTLANVAMTRAIPIHQGVDLTLAQREAVHSAWEIPREETMQKFFANHPKWQDSPLLPEDFHWKWYFAFHQVGDEAVAEQAKDYRNSLLARQAWAERLGWLLPGVGAQNLLHRVARTDLPAQLAYQDRIADFHRDIRAFYYDYLFYDRAFGKEGFARRPEFVPTPPAAAPSLLALWALLALCWAVCGVLGAVAGVSRAALPPECLGPRQTMHP